MNIYLGSFQLSMMILRFQFSIDKDVTFVFLVNLWYIKVQTPDYSEELIVSADTLSFLCSEKRDITLDVGVC